MAQRPKVVVLGAGSLFFGRQAIWQMVRSEHLNRGTLGLVDTDPVHLRRMAGLAQKAIKHAGVSLRLDADTDAGAVLAGADFVVLSFADRSARFRGLDCDVALKHGIRMCSGDTIGPGGIFRTLREFPRILEYGRRVRELCPDAWVINYINPTAANGMGLRIFLPELRSFALCDGLHMPHVKRHYAERAGLLGRGELLNPALDAAFDFRIAGPNHFTWLLKAEYEGADVTPAIAQALRARAATETDGGETGSKAYHNDAIGHALYEVFGYVPTCTAHTKEYVRFWQGLGRAAEPIPPLAIWRAADRLERHAETWRQVDGFNYGVQPMDEFFARLGPDHATDIIEAMWAGLPKPFFVNTANGTAVPNMPADAFLELLCDVNMDGPAPRPVGPAPVGLRGLWQQVLDSHELAVRAAVACDRDMLLRAMACDPLVSSLGDARAIVAELLDAERDALPEAWFA